MIVIGKPYLRRENDRALLCAPVTLRGETVEAWFSVEETWADALVLDRLDAFAVSLLPTAMIAGEDLCCEAPLTRRLHYQLAGQLIPAMAGSMARYHPIALRAPVTNAPLACAGAVGTGWTGGVDSMYTLLRHLDAPQPSRRLTHLLIAGNGAMEGKGVPERMAMLAERARRGVAREHGLTVLTADSNLHHLGGEHYLSVAGFRLPSVVLALQGLFGTFLHSGAYEFPRFAMAEENSAYYELLILACLETDATVFYSTGSTCSRIQKLRELADFPTAHQHLHPCIYSVRENNCSTCTKCLRTIAALYALGRLEDFRPVFDVDGFLDNLEDNLSKVYASRKSQHFGEAVAVLEQRGFVPPPEVLRKARIRRAAAAAIKRAQEGK